MGWGGKAGGRGGAAAAAAAVGPRGGPQWLQQSAGPSHQFSCDLYWFLYTFLHRSAGKPEKIQEK